MTDTKITAPLIKPGKLVSEGRVRALARLVTDRRVSRKTKMARTDNHLHEVAYTIPLPPRNIWDELDIHGNPPAMVKMPETKMVKSKEWYDGKGTSICLAYAPEIDCVFWHIHHVEVSR